MKLKYIFASIVAALTLFVGCQKEADHYLSEIKVDKSYVGLAQGGGSQSITMTTTGSWTVSVPEKAASWLSVSPASGSAGSVTLTVSAAEASETREATFTISCSGKTQNVNVIQQCEVTEKAVTPIADVIAAGAGSFRIRGTVTSSPNTTYGNYNVTDDTGTIYIYGTKIDGAYPKDHAKGWAAFDISVGDVVTVEGPYTLYGSTHELVDAELIKVEKSLIQVADFDFDEVPAEGGDITLVVDSKVSPLLVTSDADWLTVTDVTSDGNYVLHAAENVRTAKRTANISIKGPGAQASKSVTQAGVPATGASVSEIIAMDDDSQVQTLPSTVVVALTTRGAILSDGTKAIYAYGNSAAALSVGNGVRMSAKKTTYNGVPELTDITDVFVDSEVNAVSYPTATDITAAAGSYDATEAEYIKLSGTLSVSGNYYNIALDAFEDGSKQGSIVYPVDALGAKSFDGKKITVTGYFNGLSSKGKYINIVATRIAEFVDNPKGTVNNPFNVADAKAYIDEGGSEDVFVKGVVSEVQYAFSAEYGTATFWISDDGSAKDFEAYSVYYLGNQAWAEGDTQIAVGDEVLLCGKLTKYKDTYETSSKKAYVYALNGVAASEGEGTADAPYNVSKAMELVLGGNTPADEVYVKGVICQIDDVSTSYGNAQYWISDDGGTAHKLEIYRGMYFGGEKFTSADQIAVGDLVVVAGKLTLYKEIVEFSAGSKLVSQNGNTQ